MIGLDLGEGVLAEVQAVRESVGLWRAEALSLVAVSGPDAETFLHNQTTNDVRSLRPGAGQASATLDSKAHLVATFTLHRTEDTFLLLVDRCREEALLAQIEKYHVTEEIRVEVRGDRVRFLLVQGPHSPALLRAAWPDLGLPEAEQDLVPFPEGGEGAALISQSRTGETGFLLLLDPDRIESVEGTLREAGAQFGLRSVGPQAEEVLRIEAGIPRWNLDMTEENILPETGLEQEAVSYSKGCYLGQEVVARIKTYGAVSHALVGLSFEGDELPPSGATLRIGEKEVGEVKSGVRSPTLGAPIALAYLHRNHRASGRRLELEAEGKAQGATVVVLPFYRAVDRSERSARFAEEGMKLFAGDQEQQAIERLREAISVDPKNGDAVEALGVILSRHERYEEAIVLMKELVRVDPDSVMGHTNLSLYFMKLGMREEAEDAQGQALRLSWRMNAERARAERAEAEEQEVARQQLENRLGMFRQVLELDADDPLANLGLGQGLVQLDRFEEGLPFLQKAVEVQPGHSVTYRELGRCLEKLDRIAEAQEVYERGIAVATRRGDLMPLREMERLLGGLRA